MERWIAHGLPVLLQPWADQKGFHQPLARRLDEQFVTEREAERDRGLREGVYRLPPSQDAKDLVARGHMIMPPFFVEKATRKEVSAADWAAMSAEERIKHLRFVANLKRLNRKCRKKGVKFEGLDKLPQMGGFETLKAGTSWDVVKAFNLIEMYPPDQKLMTLDLGPSVRGPRYVMCAAMPFGYVNSPYAFTQLMKSPVGRMREAGIPTMIWLDDGLNLWPSVAEGERRLPEVDEALEHFLGPGARHPDKGEGWPKPVEVLEKHLGYWVDLRQGEFQLPPPTMSANHHIVTDLAMNNRS